MEEYHEEVVTTTTTTEDVPAVPEQRTTLVTPAVATTERVEQVTVDPYATRRIALYRVWQVIWMVLGIIEGLIAIRFILRLLGANPAAGFAQFIYGLTGLIIAPFIGLFPSPTYQGSVLETTSIVAMIVYALLAWLIVQIISLLFSESRTAVVTRRTGTRFR